MGNVIQFGIPKLFDSEMVGSPVEGIYKSFEDFLSLYGMVY